MKLSGRDSVTRTGLEGSRDVASVSRSLRLAVVSLSLKVEGRLRASVSASVSLPGHGVHQILYGEQEQDLSLDLAGTTDARRGRRDGGLLVLVLVSVAPTRLGTSRNWSGVRVCSRKWT